MPAFRQSCPKVAACWSPATPVTAMGRPNHSGRVWPISPLDATNLGSNALGIPNSSSKSPSHSPCSRL